MFKYFIFDVDGTLVNTEDLVIKSLTQTLEEYGLTKYSRDYCKKLFGMPSQDAVKFFDIKEEDRITFVNRWEDLEDINLPNAELFEDAMMVIQKIFDSNLKLGVVTSRNRSSCDSSFLEKFNLQNYFSCTISVDDCEKRKPFPEPLLKCMEIIGAKPEETIFIGDSKFDMDCANSAGVKFALALWGAGTTDGYNSVDYILNKPSDILELI